jgi:hypothetical protein
MQKFAILTCVAVVAVWSYQDRSRFALALQDQGTTPAETQAAAPEGDAQAVPGSPGEASGSPEAVGLLRNARDRLYGYRSVRARLTELAQFGERRFTAEGRYVAGPFPTLRLEFEVRLGDTVGSLLEVCDGQVLRTRKEVRKAAPAGAPAPPTPQVQVTRKDVQQILNATRRGDTPPEAVLSAELGIGGLPALLASLERTTDFDVQRKDEHQGRSYVVIQGQWKPDYLEKLKAQLGAAVQTAAMFVPDQVRVYFDQETMFPTRILYLKQASATPRTFRPMLTLEFTDVVLNEEVNPEEFRFPLRGIDEVDETSDYLRMIEAARTGVAPAGPLDGGTRGEAGSPIGEPAAPGR